MEGESNIKDITIEKGITPIPRGVWENYEIEARNFKLFQTRYYETNLNRETKPPKLLELPPMAKDLPTHYSKREGRHLGKPIKWPQASQDLSKNCSGNNECFTFKNRGYLCNYHSPFSNHSVVELSKATHTITVDNSVVLRKYLS